MIAVDVLKEKQWSEMYACNLEAELFRNLLSIIWVGCRRES